MSCVCLVCVPSTREKDIFKSKDRRRRLYDHDVMKLYPMKRRHPMQRRGPKLRLGMFTGRDLSVLLWSQLQMYGFISEENAVRIKKYVISAGPGVDFQSLLTVPDKDAFREIVSKWDGISRVHTDKLCAWYRRTREHWMIFNQPRGNDLRVLCIKKLIDEQWLWNQQKDIEDWLNGLTDELNTWPILLPLTAESIQKLKFV